MRVTGHTHTHLLECPAILAGHKPCHPRRVTGPWSILAILDESRHIHTHTCWSVPPSWRVTNLVVLCESRNRDRSSPVTGPWSILAILYIYIYIYIHIYIYIQLYVYIYISISNKRIPSQEYTISIRVCLCMSTTHDSKPYARPLPYISNTILSYTYILSTHVQWKHQQKEHESFYLKMKRPWKGTSVLVPRTCISRRELPKQHNEPIWTPIHICTYICI